MEAVLANVSVRGWSGQRTDEEITAEIAAAKGADRRAGRYIKNLIDPKALREVKSAGMFMRNLHYDMTRPWDDTGRRLLPGPLVEDYRSRMGAAKQLYDDAVTRLIAAYPALIERAKQDLGQMFDASAYPTETWLATMFEAGFSFEPIPEGRALPASLRDLADKVEADTREKLLEGQRALYGRVAKAVAELGRKIKTYDTKREAGEATKLRSSLLEEVRVLAKVLPLLNVEGDEFLNQMAVNIERDLASLDADTIKESAPTRKAAVSRIEAMIEQMKGRS